MDLVAMAKDIVVADRYFSQVNPGDRSEMGVELARAFLKLMGEQVSDDDYKKSCDRQDIDPTQHEKEVG